MDLDVRFALELAGIAFTLIGAWFALTHKVDSMKERMEEICEASEKTEAKADALHSRLDEQSRDIAVLKRDNEHYSTQLERGLSEIKGMVGSLHTRLDAFLNNRGIDPHRNTEGRP